MGVNDDIKTLNILTFSSADQIEESGIFPSPPKLLAKLSEISIDDLKDSLSQFIDSLEKVIEPLSENQQQFDVDTLTFNIAISGSGKISLIGEMAAGMNSGVSVTLKRKRG